MVRTVTRRAANRKKSKRDERLNTPEITRGTAKLRRAIAIVLSLAAPLAALAAEPAPTGLDGVTELEQIVVTATRLPMRSFAVPALVSVADADAVQQFYQSRTLPEALGEIPGVLVQKTAQGQGSPFIRGFTGFRNVLLIDGIRLNNSVFREGPNQYWNTVDPYSFNRLEVLKGPASVLYGSDAIGGAVNVLTSVARDAPSGLTPRLLYRYAGAENSSTARAEATWKGEAVRARAGYTYKDYGDVEGGKEVGEQPKTGYGEDDADLRVEYDLSADTTLTLGYQYVDQDDAWRTHRTIHGISWKGTTVGTDRELIFDQQRQLGYLQLRHAGLGAVADTMRASISYHEQTEDQHRLRSNLRSDELGFDVGTTGLAVQFDKKSGALQLVYGADWYRDAVDSYNVEYNADGSVRREHVQGPVADDATYDLAGAFVQAIVELTPRLSTTLAARYTYAAVDARQVEDPVTFQAYSLQDHWDDFSASGRVAFMPVADGPLMLYAAVSQAFRAPNLSDLTRLDTARSNELEIPSPGLSPEEYLSYEAGVKYADERWSAQAAWFLTDGSDVIVRTPTGNKVGTLNEVTKVNAADSRVYGVEGQVSCQLLPQLLVFADGVWLDGEADAYPTSAQQPVTEPIDLLMPPSWRFGARWTPASPRLQVEATVEHANLQDDLSTRDKLDTQRIPPGGTPEWTVLNLRSDWRLSDHATVSLAVENVTDEDYRIHGSGVNEPGRNVVMSVALVL
jgi:hemoglobin/transferrin/lactoferrin receptor protein